MRSTLWILAWLVCVAASGSELPMTRLEGDFFSASVPRGWSTSWLDDHAVAVYRPPEMPLFASGSSERSPRAWRSTGQPRNALWAFFVGTLPGSIRRRHQTVA